MATTVAAIIGLMEHLAPPGLAEEWDPIGLQAGHRDWPVERVWVALDPLPAVVSAACRNNVNLLITHHPLIFSRLKNLDCSGSPASILCEALQHRLAIFAAHTNFDSASDGLNDLLAARIGMRILRPLQPVEIEKVKLRAYVPGQCENSALDLLVASGADRVESRTPGLRQVRFASRGAAGGASSEEPLYCIAAQIDRSRLSGAVDALRALTGCENAPLEVLPVEVYDGRADAGLGRIGTFDRSYSLQELAGHVKASLKADWVRIAGNPDLSVQRAAICSGGGGGLLKPFLSSEAEVYITGDVKYHEAREIENAGRGLIDAGHFATEHIMVQSLAQRLSRDAKAAGLAVDIRACDLETDAFTAL